MLKFIIYGRKSKDRLNKDGTLDETQHTFSTQEYEINKYLTSLGEEGVHYVIIERHEECYSGTKYYHTRKIFKSIVDRCKKDRSITLLVSKADRLTRNLRTATELMETINFVLANAPEADDLQKHIEFMFAEREGKEISKRSKSSLAALKAKGERLGSANEKYKANPNNATKRNQEDALRRTERLIQPIYTLVNALPKVTLRKLAEALTKGGYELPNGGLGTWTPIQVSRVMKRHEISMLKEQASIGELAA